MTNATTPTPDAEQRSQAGDTTQGAPVIVKMVRRGAPVRPEGKSVRPEAPRNQAWTTERTLRLVLVFPMVIGCWRSDASSVMMAFGICSAVLIGATYLRAIDRRMP
jgi:hypothetical protein